MYVFTCPALITLANAIMIVRSQCVYVFTCPALITLVNAIMIVRIQCVCVSLSSVLQGSLCIVHHLSQLTEITTAVKCNLPVVPCNCFPAQKRCSQIS